MAEIDDWDVVAAGNGFSPPNGFPENMNYSAVNDSAREIMAVLKRNYADNNGSLVSGGAADAYTLTANRAFGAYADGLGFRFRADRTNTGPATMNVSSGGTKPIIQADGGALAAGDIVQNGVYDIVYVSATDSFVLVSGFPSALNGTSLTVTGTATANQFSGELVSGNMIATEAEALAGTNNNQIMTPLRTTQAIDNATAVTASYESSEQTITAGAVTSLSHGLGQRPKVVSAELICKVSEHGYSVNERLLVGHDNYKHDPRFGHSISLVGTTSISVKFGFFGIYRVTSKTSGSTADLSDPNWKLIVKAIA